MKNIDTRYKCDTICELTFAQCMMNQNLFPYYRRYICLMASGPALFLLLVGVAVIWYHMGANNVPVEVYSEQAFFVIFFVMFFYTGITVVLQNVKCLRCPHCGKRSVRIECDPPAVIVVSPKWQTQNTIAICPSCGYRQQTDLQKKSNMFIKGFPVKVK